MAHADRPEKTHSRRRRALSRRRRWFILGGGIVVIGWLVWAGALLTGAHGDVVKGRARLDRVRHQDLQQLVEGGALTDLRKGGSLLGRAHRRLTSPVLLPVKVLPVVGRQLRSAASLAGAASKVAAAGADAIGPGRDILQASRAPGPARVAQVDRFAALASTTADRLSRVQLGPDQALLPSLARARRDAAGQIGELVAGLRRGAAAADGLAAVLRGPGQYLLVVPNNAEMRAGSGMFLSVGVLQGSDGRLQVSSMQSVIEVTVPPGAVPLTGDLADRWGWLAPNVDWRNLMVSPRFPENAALAAKMWEASGRGPVDGVVAVDPVALQAVVQAVGAVEVAGRVVDGDHVLQELLHDQYVRFPALADRPERREELSVFASAVMTQLNAGSWSAVQLGKGLAGAARGRHVMVWSGNATLEKAWEAAGASGEVPPDSLLVSLLNRGGNKLDQFQAVDADLQTAPAADRTDVTLRIHLRNAVPAGEPPYIAGPHFGTDLKAGDYLGIAAVTVPGFADAASIDGVDRYAVAGPDGRTGVLGIEVLLAAGDERTLVVHFRLPGRHGTMEVVPSARVPQVRWRYGSTTWADTGVHVVRW